MQPRFLVRIDYRPRKRGLTAAEYIGAYSAPSAVAALCKAGADPYFARIGRGKGRAAVSVSAEQLPADDLPELTARRR